MRESAGWDAAGNAGVQEGLPRVLQNFDAVQSMFMPF